MKKTLTFFLAAVLSVANVLAASPVDVMIDSSGKIQIDDQNPRQITGCWDSDEQAVMFYRRADRTIFASEICNEPDEIHHGLGITDAARARNYYDFLNKTRSEITEVDAPIVLGSLSGYNYSFIKEFLKLPDACDKFDILAFHPYHLGVAPDEINVDKNTWHTVEQWVSFYREILTNAGCGEKPIWVTEFGFTTADHDAEKAVSESEQTDFALKELILLLGEDVERVGYFNDLGFKLSDSGAQQWNDLVGKLAGSKLEKFKLGGDKYCPRETSCFYDASEYRNDSGKTFYGLPTTPAEIKKERTYTFKKDDGSRTFVFWETGKSGINILESPFADISIDTDHADAILNIAKEGIIGGYPDGNFRPELQINRAELLKILVEATRDQNTVINGSNCFPDVSTEWFAPYVCYAKARNWVSGYPDGNFRPASPVTRAEALKIISSAFGWQTVDTGGAWFMPFANKALSEKVLMPAEAKNYDHSQNRGFIAELIWRALN